jgi:outer membrane protein assembly factor BamA
MLNGALFYSSLSLFFASALPLNHSGIKVDINGNDFFSEPYLMRGVRLPQNDRDIEILINRILDRYNDAGFPFCRVQPRFSEAPDSAGRLWLTIEEGPRVRIVDYIFHIQGKTDPLTLKKFARCPKDQFFSRRELNRTKRRIAQKGLFEWIDDRVVQRDDDYFLRVDMKDNPSDFLVAGGSLAQTDAYFFGTLTSRNLLGTLRELQAQYEYRKLFLLQYTDPIFIAPLELKIDFSLLTYDRNRLVHLGGRLTAPVGDDFWISIMSGREMVAYADSSSNGYQNNLVGIGLGFHHDTGMVKTDQEINVEYLFRTADRLVIRYDGQFELYRLFIKPHYWRVQTDHLEFFDYFRLGGAKTIRGYLEEEFVTPEILWANCEFKRFFCYPLFDFAYTEGRFFYAYGLGLDARTSLAEATLVFAWPRGGDWRDGKVHFLIEKGF